MSELPSNEPVEKSKELPANEVVGAELDNRVKIPKTDLNSQSTKVQMVSAAGKASGDG